MRGCRLKSRALPSIVYLCDCVALCCKALHLLNQIEDNSFVDSTMCTMTTIELVSYDDH